MKPLLLIAMTLIFVSCGKKDNSDPYIFEVTNFNRLWTYSFGTSPIQFDSIDLSDLNNVTVTNLKRNGVFTTCTYKAVNNWSNSFYGTLTMTYQTGDMFVCSQLVGVISYEAANDTKKGYEYLSIAGQVMK